MNNNINIDEVLSDIANRWGSFDNVTKSDIATALAGTRQRESVNILFQNNVYCQRVNNVIIRKHTQCEHGKDLETSITIELPETVSLRKDVEQCGDIGYECKGGEFVKMIKGDIVGCNIENLLSDGTELIIDGVWSDGYAGERLICIGQG